MSLHYTFDEKETQSVRNAITGRYTDKIVYHKRTVPFYIHGKTILDFDNIDLERTNEIIELVKNGITEKTVAGFYYGFNCVGYSLPKVYVTVNIKDLIIK